MKGGRLSQTLIEFSVMHPSITRLRRFFRPYGASVIYLGTFPGFRYASPWANFFRSLRERVRGKEQFFGLRRPSLTQVAPQRRGLLFGE